jgi:heme-degrading monooxygenase HmoA
MFCSVSQITCPAELQSAYLNLRRSDIDPGMAAAPGFIRRTLLRSQMSTDELLLIVYWESRDHAIAYRQSRVHDNLRDKTIKLINGRPVTKDYDILAE